MHAAHKVRRWLIAALGIGLLSNAQGLAQPPAAVKPPSPPQRSAAANADNKATKSRDVAPSDVAAPETSPPRADVPVEPPAFDLLNPPNALDGAAVDEIMELRSLLGSVFGDASDDQAFRQALVAIEPPPEPPVVETNDADAPETFMGPPRPAVLEAAELMRNAARLLDEQAYRYCEAGDETQAMAMRELATRALKMSLEVQTAGDRRTVTDRAARPAPTFTPQTPIQQRRTTDTPLSAPVYPGAAATPKAPR